MRLYNEYIRCISHGKYFYSSNIYDYRFYKQNRLFTQSLWFSRLTYDPWKSSEVNLQNIHPMPHLSKQIVLTIFLLFWSGRFRISITFLFRECQIYAEGRDLWSALSYFKERRYINIYYYYKPKYCRHLSLKQIIFIIL